MIRTEIYELFLISQKIKTGLIGSPHGSYLLVAFIYSCACSLFTHTHQFSSNPAQIKYQSRFFLVNRRITSSIILTHFLVASTLTLLFLYTFNFNHMPEQTNGACKFYIKYLIITKVICGILCEIWHEVYLSTTSFHIITNGVIFFSQQGWRNSTFHDKINLGRGKVCRS